MLEHPSMAALVLGSHLAKDILQLVAPSNKQDVRHDAPVEVEKAEPICLGDAGWLDHYGHRHLDVDVERL